MRRVLLCYPISALPQLLRLSVLAGLFSKQRVTYNEKPLLGKAMPDDPGWGHYCRKFFKFNAARRSEGTLVRKPPGLFVDGYTCNVFWFTGFK